jgi:hypothetical protein
VCLLLCTSPPSLSKLSSYSLAHCTRHSVVRPSVRSTPHSPQRPSPPARPHPTLLTLLAPARRAPHLCHRARRPPLMVLVVPSRVSSWSPPSQGHPRAQPVLVVLVRCRSASAPTPRLKSTVLVSPSPMLQIYVSSVSYGCRKSRSGCCIYYKCFRCMLQVFQRHVASVCSNVSSISDVSCKRFLSECCTCFTHMLQEYVRNILVVSVLRCNKCFHVASCKCFI